MRVSPESKVTRDLAPAFGHACRQSRSDAHTSAAFIGSGHGNGLRNLVLRVAAHVADYSHADALVGHLGNDGVAQLAFEIGDAVELARAADLAVKRFGLAQVIGVNAKAAQANGASLVARSFVKERPVKAMLRCWAECCQCPHKMQLREYSYVQCEEKNAQKPRK